MGTITDAAVAVQEKEDKSPRAFVMRYRDELTNVMPTHLTSQGEAWLRVATGALKTGKFNNQAGMFDLEIAALNNPAAFMQALRKAAADGLQPGTEQFYLTPRKVNGRLEILGITGYQGYIELMYRAGYTDSVVVETVHKNDHFSYKPGDERPDHEVDWFGDRGELIGVYAYAKMVSGATSRVVVLGADKIKEIKKKSQGSDSEYSPWKTHPDSMWMKSAVRQLRKWVPTSREIRAPGGLPVVANVPQIPAGVAHAALQAATPVGQIELTQAGEDGHQLQDNDPDQVIEGEIQEEPPAEQAPEPPQEPAEQAAEPAPAAEAPAAKEEPPVTEAPADAESPKTLFPAQAKTIIRLFNKVDITDGVAQLDYASKVLDRQIDDANKLTSEEANLIIKALTQLSKEHPAGS